MKDYYKILGIEKQSEINDAIVERNYLLLKAKLKESQGENGLLKLMKLKSEFPEFTNLEFQRLLRNDCVLEELEEAYLTLKTPKERELYNKVVDQTNHYEEIKAKTVMPEELSHEFNQLSTVLIELGNYRKEKVETVEDQEEQKRWANMLKDSIQDLEALNREETSEQKFRKSVQIVKNSMQQSYDTKQMAQDIRKQVEKKYQRKDEKDGEIEL